VKAIPYSEIGPIERGQAVPLNTETQLVLDALARDYECGKCRALLKVTVRLDKSRPFGQRTVGMLRCVKDDSHRGIRKPRRTQKPYGLPGMRGDER